MNPANSASITGKLIQRRPIFILIPCFGSTLVDSLSISDPFELALLVEGFGVFWVIRNVIGSTKNQRYS